MLNKKYYQNLLWTAFIYLFFASYIILSFINFDIKLNHAQLEFFFDSDLLYLHRLYEDIFIQYHHFLSWYFPPAPYFFPDAVVFFIFEFIFSRNVFFIIIAYAVFQYLFLLFIAQKIASLSLNDQRAKNLIYFLFLMLLVFWVVPQKDCYRFLIEASYHAGGIINGLLLLFAVLLLLKNPLYRKMQLIIGIIAFISALSDATFLSEFSGPALLTLLLFRHRLPLIYPCAYLVIGTAFGILIKYMFIHSTSISYVSFDPLNFISRLKLMYETRPFDILQHHAIAGSITIFFYSSLLLQLIFQRNHHYFIVNFLRLFILISVISTLFCISLFETNGSIFQRYMLNIYYYPFIFFWLPFFSILNKSIILKLQILMLCMLGVFALHKIAHPMTKGVRLEYYPSLVACVDNGIRQYNLINNEKLTYGVASYWQAGVITSLSKDHLQLVEMMNTLYPRYWINTPERYRKTYDFAVIAVPAQSIQTEEKYILNRRLLEKINGKPAKEFSCGNEAIVLIYGSNKLTLPA